ENWEKPVRPSKENPTWKDPIVNLKVMASSESSRQYSKRKAFGKDSGLAPEIDTLTRLPAHPAPDFSGKKQNSFTVVQDQLRKIHNLINTHEEPESEIMLPDGEETLYCPNDSVSSEEKTPESGRKYEESLEDSERLLYNHFLKDLFSSQEEVQIAAAKSLAGFPSARTGLALMEAWQKTASSRTRSEIAKTLSSLKEEGAVILFRKYLAHEELSYQMSALEGLYRMGTEAAMGGVITALRSGDHQLRRRAVTYIGWLKVPTALQELGPLLKDPNEFVRKVTLSVVSNLETPNKLPFLIETLHDSSLEIRRAAFKSLQAISGKKLAFDPRASETKRVAAIKKLKEKLT
ncbi:MAG: HEAT repeat domain-containing protein, partial [bacterium]